MCASSGSVSYNVKFTWTHNGRKVRYNKRRVLTSTGGASTLMIAGVKRRDAGGYVCEARSRSLSVMSTTAILTVNKP